MAIVESPIGQQGTREEGSVIGQVLDSVKDKGIRGRGRLDVSGKGEI